MKYVNLLYTGILILCLFLSCSDDKIIYKSYGLYNNPKLEEFGFRGKPIYLKNYSEYNTFVSEFKLVSCDSLRPYIPFNQGDVNCGLFPEVFYDCVPVPPFHYISESTFYIDSSSVWIHDRFLKLEELEPEIRKAYHEVKINPKGGYGDYVVFVFERYPHENLNGLQKDLDLIIDLYDKINPEIDLIVTFDRKYPIRMPQPKIDTNELSF